MALGKNVFPDFPSPRQHSYVHAADQRDGKGRGEGRGGGGVRNGCLIKSLDEYIRNAIRNDIKVKYGVNFKGAFSPFVCLIYLRMGRTGWSKLGALSRNGSRGFIWKRISYNESCG